MTLIWKKLLHANFRCGRMYTTRAEYGTERCALPPQTECVCECDGKAAKALNPNFARCTEMVSVTGIFYASELYFKYR